MEPALETQSVTPQPKRIAVQTRYTAEDPTVVGQILDETRMWKEIVGFLRPYLDPAFKYPLTIKGTTGGRRDREDLPINIDRFEGAVFEISSHPPEGYTIYRDVAYGYQATDGDKFKRVGALEYVAVDDKGNVVAVGAGSEAALHTFKNHLYGQERPPEYERLLRRINKQFIAYLRDDKHRPEIEAFLVGRNHHPAWSEAGQFGFLNPSTFGLGRFTRLIAREFNQEFHAQIDRRFPPETRSEDFCIDEAFRTVVTEAIFDAGITQQSISAAGTVRYTLRRMRMAIIPYFDPEDLVDKWRMRKEKVKPNEAKYLSPPLDRSVRQEPDVYSQLYLANLLKDCAGKDIILTEGEFKCHVARCHGNIVTVGIPGITMITDEIIELLANSGARSITVVLDNDSSDRQMPRTDELADAARAAYEIAKRIYDAGFENVKVGRIKDDPSGEKGLDDIIVLESSDVAHQKLCAIIENALTIQEYVLYANDSIDLSESAKPRVDTVLVEIMSRRREVGNMAEQFETMLKRGGGPAYRALSAEEKQECDKALKAVQHMASRLDLCYHVHLAHEYGGATRINQPDIFKYHTLFAKEVPRANKKCVLLTSGERLGTNLFSGDVLCFLGYPSDFPTRHRAPNAPGIEIPFSMTEVAKHYGGEEADRTTTRLITEGAKRLGVDLKSEHTFEAHALCALAGHLGTIYEATEYDMHANVRLRMERDTYIEELQEIPIVIQKKGRQVRAIATMPIWKPCETGETPPRHIIVNSQFASEEESRTRAVIKSYFREPALERQRKQLGEITDFIVETYGELEENQRRLKQVLDPLGVSERTIRENKIVYLTPDNWKQIIHRLDDKALLTQGVQAGLFRVLPNGLIVPKFKGAVLLFPVSYQGRVSLRVMPLRAIDHEIADLPPVAKLVHFVPDSRGLTTAMDPSSTLYMGHKLDRAKGKTVMLAYDELDALVLESLYEDNPNIVVVGLNADLHPRHEVIHRIKAALPREVVFVGRPYLRSRYEHMNPTDVPAYLTDLFDLSRRFRNADPDGSPGFEMHAVPLALPMAKYMKRVAEHSLDSEDLAMAILDCSRPIAQYAPVIYSFKSQTHTTVIRPLEKAIEAWEAMLRFPNVGTANFFQQVEAQQRRMQQAYQSFYRYSVEQNNQQIPESLEEFLAKRYNQSEVRPLEWYVENRGTVQLRKPLYTHYQALPKVGRAYRMVRSTSKLLFTDVERVIREYPHPIEPRWHGKSIGAEREKYELRSKQQNHIKKLQTVAQKLQAEGILRPGRALDVDIKHVRDSKRFRARRRVFFADDTVLEVIELGRSKSTADHCAARSAYEKLIPVLNKQYEKKFGEEKKLRTIWRRGRLVTVAAKAPKD